MKIALVVISDRGDLYLPRAMASAERFIDFPLSDVIMVEDPEHNMTASGAVRAGWAAAVDKNVDFVLHLEEDFVLTEPVDIAGMVTVLTRERRLAQLVLKRQPWNSSEHEAGDLLACWSPTEYEDRQTACYDWVDQRRIFSLNPCLVPRRVLNLGFPEGSERGFTDVLLEKGYSFGYWGKSTDPPRCEHIGHLKAAGSRM